MSTRQSIQTQLIVTFLLVVALSLSGLSLMQIISGARTAQEEINRQLTTVVSYKSRIIREWTSTAKAELGSSLAREAGLDDIQAVLADPSGAAGGAPLVRRREALRLRLQKTIADSRYFNDLVLIDPRGRVALSATRELDGNDLSGEELFRATRRVAEVGLSSLGVEDGRKTLVATYPILDARGDLAGILAGRVRPALLNDIFADTTGMREKAVTSLVDTKGWIVASSDTAAVGNAVADLRASLEGSFTFDAVVFTYTNQNGIPVTGAFQRLPDISSVLLVEQESQEVRRTWLATLAVNASVTISSILLAVFIALSTTRSISSPLTELVDISGEITRSAGEAARSLDPSAAPELLAAEAPAGPLAQQAALLEGRARDWQNEIGVLAQAFDRMTRQLSGLIASLEDKVAERTQAVEQHSRYLEASADVSRAATSILEPERLIPEAVELIRDRFDLYYVGLFLTDEEGEYAMLRAGTGEAGQAMLERGHRLRLEPTSMIGWAIAHDQARVAQVAGEDEVRVVNPELPLTRSEAAMPLHARGQVIGALTVQSTRFNAFDAAALQVLQTMADQLAISIDNALLFQRSRLALEAERRAYVTGSQADWDEWRQSGGQEAARGGLTIRKDALSEAQPAQSWYPEMVQAYSGQQTVLNGQRLAIPIRVRGAVVGVIAASGGRSPGQAAAGSWVGDEVTFMESIAEQLGVALDAARLYAETRKRAEQERLVDELTSRMRSTLDIQTVLETAAREMRAALGLAEVEVRLGAPAAAPAAAPSASTSETALPSGNGNGAKQV
jgi:GAF domain-containing protein